MTRFCRIRKGLAVLALAAGCFGAATVGSPQERPASHAKPAEARPAVPDYSRDIVPLFEKYCFGCHASGVTMGTFELGTYRQLMTPGSYGRVIVPYRSAESRLYLMLTGKVAPPMPLDGKQMRAGEVETIRRWIDSGAAGPRASPAPAPAR